MKHVTYADKALFVDNDAADWLMEYARALGVASGSDTVTLRAISSDGNEIEATILLNPNTELVAETTHSNVEPPTNSEAVGYMQERIRLILAPPAAQPETEPLRESEF